MAVVARVDQETELRNYLRDELRKTSGNRYYPSQEEENADAKRTDIRLVKNAEMGTVPIELKIACKNWSGSDLFERLENQLYRGYLQGENNSYGIYLLVNRNEERKWNKPVAKSNFEELLVALQEHANTIIQGDAGVQEIRVIGIDLTKRGVKLNVEEADNPEAVPDNRVPA